MQGRPNMNGPQVTPQSPAGPPSTRGIPTGPAVGPPPQGTTYSIPPSHPSHPHHAQWLQAGGPPSLQQQQQMSLDALRQQQQQQLGYGLPPSAASMPPHSNSTSNSMQQQQQHIPGLPPLGMMASRPMGMRINTSGVGDDPSIMTNNTMMGSPAQTHQRIPTPLSATASRGLPSPYAPPPSQQQQQHFRQVSLPPGMMPGQPQPQPAPPRPLSVAPSPGGPGAPPPPPPPSQMMHIIPGRMHPTPSSAPPQQQLRIAAAPAGVVRPDILLGAQVAAMAAGPVTASPTSVGPGLSRLTAFNESLALALEDDDILESLRVLVLDYFTDTGVMKFGLFDRTAQLHKIFEIPCSAFPRFQHINALCGVLLSSIQPAFVREFFLTAPHPSNGQAIHVGYLLRADEAIWSSRFSNGSKVELNGTLTAHFVVTPSAPGGSVVGGGLRIESIEFESRGHEEWAVKDNIVSELLESLYDLEKEGGGISVALKEEEERQAVVEKQKRVGAMTRRKSTTKDETLTGKDLEGPGSMRGHGLKKSSVDWDAQQRPSGLEARKVTVNHLPEPGVGSFGITEMGMRCLEIAESVAHLQDVITFSTRTGVGPIQSLATLANDHRRRMGLAGGGGGFGPGPAVMGQAGDSAAGSNGGTMGMGMRPGPGPGQGPGQGPATSMGLIKGVGASAGSIANTSQNPSNNSFYMTAPIVSSLASNSAGGGPTTASTPTTSAASTNSTIAEAAAVPNLPNGVGGVNKRKASGGVSTIKSLEAVAESALENEAVPPSGGGGKVTKAAASRAAKAARNR